MTRGMPDWFNNTKSKLIKHRRYILFRSFYKAFMKGNYQETETNVFRVRGIEGVFDPETSTLLKEIAALLQYIDPTRSTLSRKKQHIFKQIKNVHLCQLVFMYSLFSDTEQEEHKTSFLNSLEKVKGELEELKTEVYLSNQVGFHASIEAIEQRAFVKR